MNLVKFSKDLGNLKPNRKLLLRRGYSDEMIDKLYIQEYQIEDKILNSKALNHYKSIEARDFIELFNLERFRIRNISFPKKLEYVEKYLKVGEFDGGYLGLDEITGMIYIIYSDNLNCVNEIFSTKDSEYFDILLIIAEYSKNVSEGKINAFDENAKNKFIEKCYSVCPSGSYEIFL
ncbi:hypothetical protein [Galbibacter mesophilus]|uniref:hypothetical protein n=1 Tax=Galbibacter mesophilus TaxID=379069 RepID=UPI00191EF43C|nr:hypothetical protein [Galbibacter mesophilus]MCM5663285.1 hypothetical protein [Galbibacter mesophilus]